MKIFAVTVVYEPEPELLLRSIASYAPEVEQVLVWRNSPLPGTLEAALTAMDGVVLRGDGTNAGIPEALNASWREAEAGGADALLTMDQDSVWNDFPAYVSVVAEALASGDAPSRSIFAPAINRNPAPGLIPLKTAFTSGMLIPIPVIHEVGGWYNDFKVDGVDNEFCLHARSLGIRLWQAGGGSLMHQLGRVEIRRLLGLSFRVYNYSPERLYGIYRNNLIAIRKYPSVSKEFRRQFRRTWYWRRPLRILLGEREKVAKFKAIFRGIHDAGRDLRRSS